MSTNYHFKMYNKAFRYIHYVFLALCLCIFIFNVFENVERMWPIICLTVGFLALFAFRHLMPPEKNLGVWRYISPCLELMIVLPISLMTKSMLALWLVMIISNDVIIDYDFKYSIIFICAGYLLYISFYMLKLTPPDLISGVILFIIGALQFAVIMSIGYIAKKFYIQNDAYKRLAAEQKVQMLRLEEMAVLKERNRIAGDIHDTVGHQLTTALVQIEAASMLLDKDTNEARRRFAIARDQVKNGLNALRESIRRISEETQFDAFEDALLELAGSVETTTGIVVEKHFVNADGVPHKMRNAVYHACMEAITNAIRHGRCTKVWWDVGVENRTVYFHVENNGMKVDTIKPGFGISHMEKQIQSIGGTLNISSGQRGLRVSGRIELDDWRI